MEQQVVRFGYCYLTSVDTGPKAQGYVLLTLA